jgi:ferredoxin
LIVTRCRDDGLAHILLYLFQSLAPVGGGLIKKETRFRGKVMRHKVTIEDTGESYNCTVMQTLLQGMTALGKKGIPVGCRGGGCGVCKVQITSGEYTKKKMSRAYVSEHDEAENRVLACRCNPASDVTLKVIGKLEKAVKRQ